MWRVLEKEMYEMKRYERREYIAICENVKEIWREET
jgi:hypothetical protein